MDKFSRQYLPDFDRAAKDNGGVEMAAGGDAVDGLSADGICSGCTLYLSGGVLGVASVCGGI